jgi:hypothetical protein
MTKSNRFFYFICNIGSESFLKEQIKLFHPELAFSFSMPGFLTFKLLEDKLSHEEFVFCRHFGEFIAKGSKESLEKEFLNSPMKKVSYSLNGDITQLEELSIGDKVIELIEIKPNEYYLGKFIVNTPMQKMVAGKMFIDLPPESPSRAYLKILEGAKAVGVNFKAGETALEIGSSPGGATYALLSQGLNVIGVDPGEMSDICKNHPLFKHFKQSIQDFKTERIENKKIDWFLVDMNLAPEATLAEIEKIFLVIKKDFKGAFITLKMTKMALVDKIPFYIKLIKRIGLNPKYLTQLPGHKQEFLLYVEPIS